MSSSKQHWFACLAALAAVTIAVPAGAQIDTNPPLQDVLLLVDTSGSMEFASDGSKVACDQVDATLANEPKAASQKNR